VEEKIRIYQTLVTTLMLYATETRIWSNTQLARMEAVQMRHLRRIVRSPVHLTLESNDKIREKYHTPSMTSQIQVRRLKLWTNIAQNNVEEVVAVIWGEDEDKEGQMKKIEEDRERQLLEDLTKLMNENEISDSAVDTNKRNEIMMGKKTWECIKNIKKSQFKKLMGHQSTVEKRQKQTFGPQQDKTWQCNQCTKKFSTALGLNSHVVRSHNYRSEQRKLVSEIKESEGKHRCLLCDGVYVNKKGAQLHIDRHCAKKFTPEEIVGKLIRHNLI
jgi:hypothetical protein